MRPLGKLTWVELKLFVREPVALVFVFAFPLVVLASLAGSFDPDDEVFRGAQPADYYLASYVGVVVAAVGLIALPVHLASYRERGVFRRYRASSLPVATALAAQAVVALAVTIVGALVLVVVGHLALGGALPEEPATVVVSFLVATAAFLAVGAVVGGAARTARAAQGIGLLLFFPFWLLSGAGPPPEVMDDVTRRVSEVLPLTYAVRAIQDPWIGQGPAVLQLLVLAVLLAAAALAATRLFRHA